MIRKLFVILLLSIILIGGSAFIRLAQSSNPNPCQQDHEAWLAHVLEKMETIKPGMTRWDVLLVFRTERGPRLTEAGPLTGLRETFVNQDCPYFKIDVEFKPKGIRNQDVIVKVSKPYVRFTPTN